MADILTREEIDALLTAVSSGEVKTEQNEGPKVEACRHVAYDFRRPRLVSTQQMRALQTVHDTFAKSFSNALSLHLRATVKMNIPVVEQCTYGEFILSLPNPTYITLFSMSPLKGLSLLEINPALVYAIVDRLAGGEGTVARQVREFTEIEQSLMLGVVQMVLERLQETWKHMATITCRVEGRESNPRLLQICSLTDSILLITFSVEIGNNTGTISLCIPSAVLAPVLSHVSAHQWIPSKQRSAETTRLFREALRGAEVSVCAILGEATLSVNDIVQLQRDDVIVLDRGIHDEIMLQVEKVPRYFGRPGMRGNRLAVQVTRTTK